MKSTDDRNSVEKALDVIEALSGCAVKGVANSTLAGGLGLSPSTVTVTMKTLIEKGWARKDEATGLFHPTPRMARVFGRVLADFDKAEQELADRKLSFTRT